MFASIRGTNESELETTRKQNVELASCGNMGTIFSDCEMSIGWKKDDNKLRTTAWSGCERASHRSCKALEHRTRKESGQMKKLVLAVAMVVGGLAIYTDCLGGTTTEAPSTGFVIKVQTVNVSTSLPAYFGEGPALSNPMSGFMGMSMMFMGKEDDGKTYSYSAQEITPASGRTLIQLDCEIANTADVTNVFVIGDIRVTDGKAEQELIAVGWDYPFVKVGQALDSVKKKPIQIDPKGTRTVKYVFAIPIGTKDMTLTYKHKKTVPIDTSKGK